MNKNSSPNLYSIFPLAVFTGLLLLCFSFTLLFFRAAPLINSLIWLVGLSLSALMACTIAVCALREMMKRNQSGLDALTWAQSEIERLSHLVEKMHLLHQEKIDACEKERAKQVEEGWQKLDALRLAKTTLQSHLSSYKVSLEDALDRLREKRAEGYLYGCCVPPDLPQKHRQLREQFDEKSLILEQTRRRLFHVEGELFYLRRQMGEEEIDSKREETLCKRMEELVKENRELEAQVVAIEKLLSIALASSSKQASKRRAKSKNGGEQMVELEFMDIF